MRASKIVMVAVAVAALAGAAHAELVKTTYAFSPALLIDLKRSKEVLGRVIANDVADCSTATMYCLKGRYVQVVWPSKCELSAGEQFRLAGLETKVSGSYPETVHLSTLQISLLTTATTPNSVYLVAGGQLVGVVVGFDKGPNLTELTESGELGRLLARNAVPPSYGSVNRLMSLDKLGGC